LDADPGQPELSPPGMLSLTCVSKPLLSPSHVHMVCGENIDACASSHIAAYFLGDVSSKSNPIEYTNAISNLEKHYLDLSERNQPPLVVNTDGWVKGMGFELLIELVRIINPTIIIQLQGTRRGKMFDTTSLRAPWREVLCIDTAGSIGLQYSQHDSTPLMTPLCGPSPAPSRVASINNLANCYEGNTCSNGALTTPTDFGPSTSKVSASDLRRLRLATYFLGGSSEFNHIGATMRQSGIVDASKAIPRNLSSMKPYRIPFRFINCQVLEHNFDIDMTLTAMNGGIVGLCCADEYGSEKRDLISSSCCFGLGIVRSIDYEQKLFYVLTPVPKRQLKKVTTFIKGRLSLPVECTDQNIFSHTFPYVSDEGVTSPVVGNAVMRGRSNPTRKFSRNR